MGTFYKNGGVDGPGPAPAEWSEDSKQSILAQLARILESHHFRSSKRCSLFLRYVVEHTISNDHEILKERTLGVEIFGREPLYDTTTDPVIRTTAGEVRKRLAQYYLEPDHQQQLRIGLPAGAYVPEIHLHPEPVLLEVPPQSPKRAHRWPVTRPVAAGIAAALVVLGTLAATLAIRNRQTDFDRFWEPLARAQGPVVICAGQPHAFAFNRNVQAALDKWFAAADEGARPPLDFSSVAVSDIVPAWDRHISLSEAEVFAALSTVLLQKGQTVQLRGVHSTSLEDLRGRPSVLLGAFNNQWNLSLTGDLRYYFQSDGGPIDYVRDRQHPAMSDWKVPSIWPHRNTPTDYALVTRVVNPTTEQTVVTIAGITGYGTQSAGEFLTNPKYFNEAFKQARRDWYRKNVQVVLTTTILSGVPGPPKVLALYVW